MKKFSFLPQIEIFLFSPALIAPNVQKNPAWAPIGVYKWPKYKIENGGTLAGHTVCVLYKLYDPYHRRGDKAKVVVGVFQSTSVNHSAINC